MTKNIQGKNQSAIVFGVLLAVVISVSAIIAYVYFQPSSKSLSQKKIINEIAQPASEVIENREVDLAAKDISSSDLIEDSKVDSKPEEQLNNTLVKKNQKDTVLAFKSSPRINNRAGSSSYSERTTSDQGQQRAVSSHESGKTDKSVRSGESGIIGSSPMHSSRSVNSSGIETTNTETDPSPYIDDNFEESSPLLDENAVEADVDPDPVDAPVSNVSVSRFLNSIGNSVAVMLTINVENNAPNGLIVKEKVPAGWNVSGISENGSFNASTGEIKWLFYGTSLRSMTINYKLDNGSGSADGLSINGNYLYNSSDGRNMTVKTGGANGA